MNEEQKLSQTSRLNDLVADYQSESKTLNDLLFKIYRLRNEIKIICDNLGIELEIPEIEEPNEDKQQ